MRKLSLLVLAIFLALLLSYPIDRACAQEEDVSIATEESKEKTESKTCCPTTLITDNDKCMDCHVMVGKQFTVKIAPSDANIKYPSRTRIVGLHTDHRTGRFELYGPISSTRYDELFEAMRFFHEWNITHIDMEIYSYGGDLFAGWRIKGLIDEWIATGNTFNTKVLGAAVSAAAVLFATGQERMAHVRAEIMYHELWTFTFFEISTPSDTEEKARVLRHMQDNIADWLSKRTKLNAKEWTDLMRNREHWIYGREAFKIGLATKLIGE